MNDENIFLVKKTKLYINIGKFRFMKLIRRNTRTIYLA